MSEMAPASAGLAFRARRALGAGLRRALPFLPNPSFTGWGMVTMHALPWEAGSRHQRLAESFSELHDLKLSEELQGVVEVDDLRWRHSVVAYAVRYACSFAPGGGPSLNLVECGVGDGMTAYVALREVRDIAKGILGLGYRLDLYDAWAPMLAESLLDSEVGMQGHYHTLSVARTKENLKSFTEHVHFHIGYIPESLTSTEAAPDNIQYLHIDLNSAAPTVDALEFFVPRLTSQGVVLFDDYGFAAYADTRVAVDKFLDSVPGLTMMLPTGQAMFFKK